MKFSKITIQSFYIQEFIDDDILAILELDSQLNMDVLQRASRRRKAWYAQMNPEQKRRRQLRFPKAVLCSPDESPAQRVLDSDCDQSYVTFTGYDKETFQYLLEKFEPMFLSNSPFSKDGLIRSVDPTKRVGRKRALTAQQALALYLFWTRTNGNLMAIQLVFGITKTSLCVYLKFARRILINVLATDEFASISFPDGAKIAEMQEIVREKYPAIDGTCFVMDGLKLDVEKSSCVLEQNAFYNGWQHSHWVVNILVFDLTGKVIACGLNAPGSWHDSLVCEAYGVYDKLRKAYDEHGAKTAVDSAFSVSGANSDFLIKSGELHHAQNADHALILSQATSMRQASEWGVNSWKKSFPRLKDKLRFERDGERGRILLCMILLHNLRVEKVGQNQLKTVFFKDRLAVEATNLFI